MHLKEIALYNLLKINWREDPSIAVEPWQVEDYRSFATDELLDRLDQLGIQLTTKNFLAYAENSNHPEELAEFLWIRDEDDQDFDKAYLLIFELWRRLLPEKQSLSIFCDELDYRIEQYDKGLSLDEELIQDALEDLEDILDESLDEGEDPHEMFKVVCSYCAHDLENFLYDYISDQIDLNNETYASELLDGFYPYVRDQNWFDFLRVRLLAATDMEKANLMLTRLLGILQESPDMDLLIEIVVFLAHMGNPQLFLNAVRQAFGLIKTKEDFQDLMKQVLEYYRLLDIEDDFLFMKDLIGQIDLEDSKGFSKYTSPICSQFLLFLNAKQNQLNSNF